MHHELASKRVELAELCRRFGVTRLEVFGSAARGTDFDPDRSDFDFIVEFKPSATRDITAYLNLVEALESLFGRRVDLVERGAIEKSPNYIRRRAILRDAETLYG